MNDRINTERIRCYLRFDFLPDRGKTPKYGLSVYKGFFPVLDELKGKRGAGKGKVELTLVPAIDDKNPRSPEVRLQAKAHGKSLNFGGLKQYWDADGNLTGYAYSEPPTGETFGSKDKRNNPFFPDYTADAMLFKFHNFNIEHELNGIGKVVLPEYFEVLIIEGGRSMAKAYLSKMKRGGYDGELERDRE